MLHAKKLKSFSLYERGQCYYFKFPIFWHRLFEKTKMSSDLTSWRPDWLSFRLAVLQYKEGTPQRIIFGGILLYFLVENSPLRQ